MQSAKKQLTRLTLAVTACTAALLVGFGCDKAATADQQVSEKVSEARIALASGTEQSLRQAQQSLEAATAVADASDSTVAQAKSALGASQMQAARVAMDDVARHESAVAALALEISALAGQVATGNALVAGYQKLNPGPVRADLTQKIAEAKGGPDKPSWVAGDTASVPTLSAVAQEISRIEGEITQKQGQVKDLEAQRVAALGDSETAMKESEAAKGRDAVDAFKRSADARRKASDFATQIEVINAAIAPLQRDLEIAKGQQQVVTTAVAEFESQQKTVDAGWSEVQKQIAAQKALSQQFAQGPDGAASATTGAAGRSIAEKAKALAESAKKADDAREAALASLSSASKQFEDAAAGAEKSWSQYQTWIGDDAKKNSRDFYKTASDVNSTSQYRMQLAGAKQAMAGQYAGKAASLSTRKQLADAVGPILTGAGATMPPELADADFASKIKQSVDLADQQFESATSTLENVASGRSASGIDKACVSSAMANRVLALYARAQLHTLAGNADKAKQYDSDARDAVKRAIEAGAPLPSLPGSLAVAVAKPAEPVAPTTQPATQPAVAPGL